MSHCLCNHCTMCDSEKDQVVYQGAMNVVCWRPPDLAVRLPNSRWQNRPYHINYIDERAIFASQLLVTPETCEGASTLSRCEEAIALSRCVATDFVSNRRQCSEHIDSRGAMSSSPRMSCATTRIYDAIVWCVVYVRRSPLDLTPTTGPCVCCRSPAPSH